MALQLQQAWHADFLPAVWVSDDAPFQEHNARRIKQALGWSAIPFNCFIQ